MEKFNEMIKNNGLNFGTSAVSVGGKSINTRKTHKRSHHRRRKYTKKRGGYLFHKHTKKGRSSKPTSSLFTFNKRKSHKRHSRKH